MAVDNAQEAPRVRPWVDHYPEGITWDASINDTPVQGLTGSGAGPYTFTFARPPTGSVQVAFAPSHGIQDVATPERVPMKCE